ncbi:MAG: methyl-accepting chemotaxis protein [Clostridia bacterium]|nr:methyl-accepting chemotaxis protein [Clostridia bacterium]
MTVTKINEADIRSLRVASLPSRPTAPTSFGGAGYTARQMKEAFDKLPLFIISRFNALLDDLCRSDGEGVDGAIPSGIRDGHSLRNLLEDIRSGAFSDYLNVLGKTLSETVLDIKSAIASVRVGLGENSDGIEVSEERINELEGEIASILEVIDTVKSSIATQGATIGTINSDIEVLYATTSSTQMYAEQLDLLLIEYRESLSTLERLLEEAKSSCTESVDALGTRLDGEIEGIRSDVESLENRVDSSYNELSARIDGISAGTGSTDISGIGEDALIVIDCGSPDDLLS